MKLYIKTLYIVSTPIGNLDDITLRAIEVLKNSDIILCEDTRHSLKLLNHLKIKKKLISYHKFNEKKQVSKIIEYINGGKILSLISDAGTPLLSDPGRLLVNQCIDNFGPIDGIVLNASAKAFSGLATTTGTTQPTAILRVFNSTGSTNNMRAMGSTTNTTVAGSDGSATARATATHWFADSDDAGTVLCSYLVPAYF